MKLQKIIDFIRKKQATEHTAVASNIIEQYLKEINLEKDKSIFDTEEYSDVSAVLKKLFSNLTEKTSKKTLSESERALIQLLTQYEKASSDDEKLLETLSKINDEIWSEYISQLIQTIDEKAYSDLLEIILKYILLAKFVLNASI